MKPLRSAIILGLLVGIPGASSLAQVPKPDPLQGDGRVSEFYTWSGELSGPPGRLLRSEPLPATLGLANAASQERILYTSTDGVEGKSLIAVSGALFIPKGTPPQEGWPLLAWAHGTEEPRHPPIARKPADRHNDQAESKSTSTTLDDSVAALDISSG